VRDLEEYLLILLAQRRALAGPDLERTEPLAVAADEGTARVGSAVSAGVPAR
jgi:hypothetical protein